MLTAELDQDELQRGIRETRTALRLTLGVAVARAADEGVAKAKRVGRFKDRTGELRREIRRTPVRTEIDEATSYMESPAKHSSFVEEGTDAHEIHPKASHNFTGPLRPGQTRRKKNDYGVGRGSFLRFYVGGREVFARMVNHPGSRPYPFMGPAYYKAEHELRMQIEAGIVRIQERIWS